MSVSLSDRERTALIAIAAASPNRPADGAVPTVNGVQLRVALWQAGFRTTSVQGAHQTAASLVRSGLVVKDYGPGGVRYGPLTVDGAEALPVGRALPCAPPPDQRGTVAHRARAADRRAGPVLADVPGTGRSDPRGCGVALNG